MAWLRVELLVLLTGILLLVSVRGWERINGTQLLNFYETGKWAESPTSPGDSSDYDNEDNTPEDSVSEVEGVSTTDNFDPFADHGFQVESVDSAPRNWAGVTDSRLKVDALPRSNTGFTSQSSTGLNVDCSDAAFKITLPTGLLSEVKVLGSKHLLPVMEAPASCDYDVNLFQDTLTVPFTGCHVNHANGYSLQLLYVNELGRTEVDTVSCDPSQKLFPRSSEPSKPTSKCSTPTIAPPASTLPRAQNCVVAPGEQVTCGHSGISSSDCEKMGCCVDSSTSACFYPMDECTTDQHFVFAIRSNSAPMMTDPTKLVIPGSDCKPVIVNDDVAIFKFKVTECGVRAYEVGETKIYLAEVQTVIHALNLKYGVITRSDPIRFMVECRYGKRGTSQQSLASVGYMVKTPNTGLPSAVISNGLYAVQLRISKDQTYTSYLPTYHQPLRLLLGKPVYLELNLKSPKPEAVILVNYCLAYPRSAKNALVLVYEGCGNPYDPNVSILQVDDLPDNRRQRRFVVKAFQFMHQKTNVYLDEEIYFMCSTEVCRPGEKTCEERCFDGKAR